MNSYETPPPGGQKKEIPDYERKFGHIAEDIIREATGKKGVIVEEVEKGTRFEDCDQKVDFWTKFIRVNVPLGIQVTTNPEEYEGKKEFLRKRNFIAQKTNNENAAIDYAGKATVVVVLLDHAKMLNYWKKMELEKKSATEVVSDEFVRDFLSKVYIEVKEANPALYNILMDLARTIGTELKSQKSKGK